MRRRTKDGDERVTASQDRPIHRVSALDVELGIVPFTFDASDDLARIPMRGRPRCRADARLDPRQWPSPAAVRAFPYHQAPVVRSLRRRIEFALGRNAREIEP